MINRSTAEVRIAVQDETGTRGLLTANIRGTTSIAAAREAVQTVAALLPSVSDCVVTGYSIVYKTIVQEGVSGDDINKPNHAVLIFNTNIADEYGYVLLPEINEDLLLPDNEIDVSNSDMAAFIAALVNGIWCTPFGRDLVELEAALYEVVP